MIILPILLLFLIGMTLSAFFSGSETGFYRISRVRLVMDGLEGHRTSQRLLYFANHPPLFVATALVGNNFANYLTSLAIVLAVQHLVGPHASAELTASILFSPVIFVFGELLPKNVFHQAPNRLLKLCGRPFTLFAFLFAPISAVLWGLGRLLERVLGQSPEKIHLNLAKKELDQVLLESQDLGILQPTQRFLAQNFFLVASRPISQSSIPMSKAIKASVSATRNEILDLAHTNQLEAILIVDKEQTRPLGYVPIADLQVQPDAVVENMVQPLNQVSENELHGEVLLQLHAGREPVAEVLNEEGRSVGVVTLQDLSRPLLSGPLVSLRRQT